MERKKKCRRMNERVCVFSFILLHSAFLISCSLLFDWGCDEQALLWN
jgi:hypothetical protein